MTELYRVARPSEQPTAYVGTVVSLATSGPYVNVNVLGTLLRAPTLNGPYAAGDIVQVTFTGAEVLITGRISNAPASTPPPPPPLAPIEHYQTTVPIPPASRGTYRGGSWLTFTDTITQGDWGWGRGFGAAFYGDALVALGADLALGHAISINMHRTAGGAFAASAPTMRLLAERTRPSGQPTVLQTETGPSLAVNESTAWTLPAAWAVALLNGTAGGVGMWVNTDAPYQNYASTGGQFVLAATTTREG